MPAARRLKVDHTTVSRRVAELERSLDVKLFDRKPEGFVMTEEGQKLLDVAKAIEEKALTIQDALGGRGIAEPVGNVRVASMEGIAAFYLARKFAELSAQHSDIVIELVTERHLISLPKREADILLSFVPPGGKRLKVSKVGEFRLALFASKDYLARCGCPVSKRDLNHHDFVDYIEDLLAIEPVHWLLDVLDPEKVVFRSSSMAAQQNAAAAGLGIALLPLFSAKSNTALIPILADDIIVKRDLYVAVHEEIEFLGRIRAVSRYLASVFERDRAFLNDF